MHSASAPPPQDKESPRRLHRQKTLNKHQQRTDTTKRALIAAARRIFSRTGFEASRIEDIVGAIGHSRGSFYAHFESKEDLFFAMLEAEANKRLTEIEPTLRECKTVAEQTRMLRQFYVSRACDRQWALLMLEFRLFALRHPALRARLAATHRRIRASLRFDIIDDVLRANKLNDRAADATKIALEALLNGLVLEHAYDPQRISLEQIKTQLARYFDSLLH